MRWGDPFEMPAVDVIPLALQANTLLAAETPQKEPVSLAQI